MFSVNILIFLLSRVLDESLNPESYSLIYLNLTEEESRGKGSFCKGPKRGGSEKPKNFKTFYCLVSYPVLL